MFRKQQRFVGLTCEIFRVKAAVLLDNLDCAFWALNFACSADQAFFRFDGDGFLFFDFVDAYWTRINTRAASCAFSIVYDYFHHFISLLRLEFH